MSYYDEYFCTNCGAVLNEQDGFDPSNKAWVCTECGQHLMDDSIYEGDKFDGVEWRCDCCNALLNTQSGFSDSYEEWVCLECGHNNSVTENNIIDDSKIEQCPFCGDVLNKQSGYFEYCEDWECFCCGKKLHRNHLWEELVVVEDVSKSDRPAFYDYKEEEFSSSRHIFDRNKYLPKTEYKQSGVDKNEDSPWALLLVCVLFGYIGIHKFMEGKTVMGILYMLTGGLFGIGWMVDIFNYLNKGLNK